MQKGDAVDVLIGDPTIDPHWIIEGAPRERVVRMLEDPALRAHLRQFHGVSEPSVMLEDDHVRVSELGFPIASNVLGTERIELALALAEAAAAESARPLEANPAGDYRTATRPDGRGELAEIAALKRLRAAAQLRSARWALVVTQLMAPAMLVYMTVVSRAGRMLPGTVAIPLLVMHLACSRLFAGNYWSLRKVAGPSSADTLPLVVVGLANLLLVGMLVRTFLG